jgi:iron complex outermembrane recepter protein
MKSLSLVVFILIFCHNALGQQQVACPWVIRGKVVHSENGESIEAAHIYINELNTGVISDSRGNFRIQNLCPGDYTLKVQYLGHKTYETKINVTANTNYTVRLEAQDLDLEGVDIHGHQDAVLTTNTISSIYGEVLRSLRGKSLGETLKRIPGITTFSSGNNIQKPVIHGLHSNRILILNNGIRLEGQQWGRDHAPEIDPFLAKDIAVVKGAETVRFGPDAMGGVILVNPAPLPVKATSSGDFSLIGFSNGRGLNAAGTYTGGSAKIKGLGYRIQGSGKQIGNVQSPGYIQNNTGLRELNFSSAVGYSSSRLGAELYFSHYQSTIGILRDAHTGNLTDLEAIIANGRPFSEGDFTYSINNPQQAVGHQLAKAKLHYHLPNSGMLNLQYGFQRNQRQEFDRRRGELNERASLEMVLFSNTLDLSYVHKTRKNWNGSLGINMMQQANSNIPGTGVIPLIPNFDLFNIGFFAIEKYTSGPLELEAGVRYDYRTVDAARFVRGNLQERAFEFQNFTSFIGGVYSFSPSLTFNSSLGTAWRPPNINEQFSQGLHHGMAAVELGNPDFVSERALKWLNTLNYSGSKINIEATAYANRINNYIYLNPTDQQLVSLRGSFNVFEYLQADADFWGFDFSAIYQLSDHWDVFSRSSIVRAKNRLDDSFFPFIPADRIETGINYNLDLNNASPIQFGISHLAVARQNREPIFDFAPAPEAYHLWNISASSKYELSTGNLLHFSFEVDNLFNRLYKDYMNQFRYYTHELGRNLIFKIHYEF